MAEPSTIPDPGSEPLARPKRPRPRVSFDPSRVRSVTTVDRRGFFARLRIRKKLLLLHTLFSLTLGGLLLLAIRPAINDAVSIAEIEKARFLLESGAGIDRPPPEGVAIRSGSADALGLSTQDQFAAISAEGRAVHATSGELAPWAIHYTPNRNQSPERFDGMAVVIPEVRSAATRMYVLLVGALLVGYFLVALALEFLVLPRNVYDPIRRMLDADAAIQRGSKDGELIPTRDIPQDELGDIMRSRNESIIKLRTKETALNDALAQLEAVANDLKAKNHLLETARRNLADADRLASLGMMSAGIAHELNTPLAVLKGLTESLNANPRGGVEPATAALMLRVVGRLERLGDSLLDFARVRPPMSRVAPLQPIVAEALTLVGLDREAANITFVSDIKPDVLAECDADRLVQVFVNIIRNAVDAMSGLPTRAGSDAQPTIEIRADLFRRDERDWVSITIADQGPGIDPAILARLFEPFASTRLDARGSGLGLAVSEGIIREHGGLILARNRSDRSGAIFEVILPATPTSQTPTAPPVTTSTAFSTLTVT
jgi:signal transduction histidine kinase